MNYAALLRGKDVFVEGVGFIGKVGDIELPKISFKQADVNNMKIDTGVLEPMEAKLTLNELNDILWTAVSKRLKDMPTFVVKASAVSDGVETSIYVEMSGWVSESENPVKNVGDAIEVTLNINVQTYRLEIDGKEKYGIDIPNYICKIDGVDTYETLRKHIM
jgi:hypothetical protein